MDRKEFLEYLALYGGDLEGWPEEIRNSAENLCARSIDLREALEEERRFEDFLMERIFEEPSPGLESRIISAASKLNKPEAEGFSLLGLLNSIFSAIPFPKPAIALPLLLVIGMAVGYLYSNYSDQQTIGPQLSELINYGEGYYE